MDVSCHRLFLPGTSLEPAVIPVIIIIIIIIIIGEDLLHAEVTATLFGSRYFSYECISKHAQSVSNK